MANLRIPDLVMRSDLYCIVTLPGWRQKIKNISPNGAARQESEGQQSKMEMGYYYLTGTSFRHRVQAIVEAFSSMQEDLNKGKKAITKQWVKREEQIERVMLATVGVYGDLRGIAGKSI